MSIRGIVLIFSFLILTLCLPNLAEADFERGLKAAENEDFETALAEWRVDAGQGHPKAQNGLGVLFENGWGIKKDYVEAVRWYRLSAKKGYAQAQNNLGIMYINGRGVKKDATEAAYWYRLAADQGHEWAQANLGYLHFNGEGISKNYSKAVHWYHLAADQGNVEAQNYLGVMYKNGWGVTKNHTEAIRWYRLAANQGLANAQFNLGLIYDLGEVVSEDNAEAVHWYRLAANQGLATAQYNLGLMYDNGEGLPENDTEAIYWYRLAAEQGDEDAKVNLGIINENAKVIIESPDNTREENLRGTSTSKRINSVNSGEKELEIPTSVKVIGYIILTIISVVAYYKTVKLGREEFGLKLVFSNSFGLILLCVVLGITSFFSYDIIKPEEIVNGVHIPSVKEYGIDLYVYSSISGLCFIGAFLFNIKKSNFTMGIYFTIAQILSLVLFVFLILAIWGWFNEQSKKLKF